MDFQFNDDQLAILDAVHALLEKHAGAARAIELQPDQAYDAALDGALEAAGFTDVGRSEDTGPLEAAVVCEAVARAAGVVAFGAAALVAPALDAELAGPIAIALVDHRGPIRFAAHARTLLVLDRAQDAAQVVALAPGDAEAIQSNFGYPMGTCSEAVIARGESLGRGSARTLEDWWRLALAAEVAGTMGAALDHTVSYLKERRQFGRAIGSFQAVQHRLAGCAIAVEASRWLAYEAAYRGAPTEMAAAAAAYALAAAGRVFAETHQLSGAIGFTREHDLHVWTMRLQALRLELGGVGGHRRALAAARWRAGGPG